MSKFLFVCTANRDRSRTTEIYFANKYPEHRFRSAGINAYLCSNNNDGIHIKKAMLDRADRIICMERCHSEWIARNIDKSYLEKIEVLDLGDTDTYMSDNLIKALEEKFKINLPEK